MPELKPCPFCGSEPVYQKFNVSIPGRIICACGAEMRQAKYQPMTELVEIWNTRAERTCRNVLDEGSFGCSVCGCHVRNLPFGSTYVRDGKRWYSTEKRTLNYCPHCGAKVVE